MKPSRRTRKLLRQRRAQPGMALMLVLILIVMVSAAGVFAAQAGALEVRSSGFTRQAAQTHYVAETGVLTALTALNFQCGMYSSEMDRRAGMTVNVESTTGLREAMPQYSFGMQDFNPASMGGTSRIAPFNGSLFQSRTGSAAPFLPGSFGPGILEADFTTVVSRLYVATQPQFGWALAGGPNWQPPAYDFQFDTQGFTRLTVALSGSADYRGSSRGGESARVLVQVPCL